MRSFHRSIMMLLALAVAETVSSSATTAQPWTPGPAAEMARLEGLIGTWDLTITLPDGRSTAAPAPIAVARELGGTTIRLAGRHPFAAPAVDLDVLIAYDRFNHVYRFVVADDQSGQLDVYEGTYEGSRLVLSNVKTNTFISDPATGAAMHARIALEIGPDAFVIESSGSTSRGRTWGKPTILRYARREEEPSGASMAALIGARTLAYDAVARNDAAGLRNALALFERLDTSADPWPSYYASWTAWSLAPSYLQAGDQSAAKASLETAVRQARRAVSLAPASAECQNMLANALIGLAVTDRSQFQTLAAELAGVRRAALELGPRNPRVVMMDAGMIFNIPPQYGGDQQKGIARWLDAIARFDAEAATAPSDEREPRWGRDLAYGWLSDLYLRLSPPDLAKAREAADRALVLRPDFWWVRTTVLPKLDEKR